MTFQLDHSQNVCKSIHRIANHEIDKSIDELSDQSIDRHEVVHRVRVHCKKLRALIRLVRPALGRAYRVENNHFRNAAQQLSCFRDAKVMLSTYDEATSNSTELGEVTAHPIRDYLARSFHEIDNNDLDRRLAELKDEMLVVKQRVDHWHLKVKGFDLLAVGFQKTHDQAVGCLHRALQERTTESLHEFRKQAKYHWYHMRLLQPVWPEMFLPYVAQLTRLSDLLGNHHNIAVLRDTWLDAPRPALPIIQPCGLLAAVDERSDQLVNEALPLARLLFAESSKSLVKRMRSYWKRWHH